jgi:hypothetical protein
MIDVKENTDGTFTISWDEEGPEHEIFKQFKTEDFIKILKQYAKESERQSVQSDNYQQEHIKTYYNNQSEEEQYDNYIQGKVKEIYGDQSNQL